MSDTDVTINSGTKEQVTLDLTKLIMTYGKYHNEDEILGLYEKCRLAVYKTVGR